MICYLDKTFCMAKCATVSCHRNFTSEVSDGAKKWWHHDPENAPIAFSDFSDGCDSYVEVKDE